MATRAQARRAQLRRRRLIAALVAVAAVIVVVLAVTGLVHAAGSSASAPTATATASSAAPAPTTAAPTPTPTAPASPAALECATPTVVSIWAHQDDDLIFANPDLTDDIAAGDCVRTLYVTAGDAGRGTGYYRSRELGILRAYNVARGTTGQWDEQDLTLLSGAHLTVFTPQGDPALTAAFLRLPDGGLDATGFAATGNVSLPKLEDGQVGSMAPLDGGPALTEPQLLATLEELVQAWHADQVYTSVPVESSLSNGDHPDHAAVGSLVRQAAEAIGYPDAQVRYYLGYPSEDQPANITGDVLTRKLDIYRTYAAEDPVVACSTNDECLQTPRFGEWLQRSYAKDESELGIP